MIDPRGIALIRFYESLKLKAYLCQAGVPTIGWGTTRGVTMADVRNGRTITANEAERLFQEDLAETEREIRALLKRPANPAQMGALMALVYNIGGPAFASSSVLRHHNAGNFAAAKASFELWNKVTDPKTKQLVVSNGLTARRAKEAALYGGG